MDLYYNFSTSIQPTIDSLANNPNPLRLVLALILTKIVSLLISQNTSQSPQYSLKNQKSQNQQSKGLSALPLLILYPFQSLLSILTKTKLQRLIISLLPIMFFALLSHRYLELVAQDDLFFQLQLSPKASVDQFKEAADFLYDKTEAIDINSLDVLEKMPKETAQRLRALKYLEQDLSDFLENKEEHKNFDSIVEYTIRMRNQYGDMLRKTEIKIRSRKVILEDDRMIEWASSLGIVSLLPLAFTGDPSKTFTSSQMTKLKLVKLLVLFLSGLLFFVNAVAFNIVEVSQALKEDLLKTYIEGPLLYVSKEKPFLMEAIGIPKEMRDQIPLYFQLKICEQLVMVLILGLVTLGNNIGSQSYQERIRSELMKVVQDSKDKEFQKEMLLGVKKIFDEEKEVLRKREKSVKLLQKMIGVLVMLSFGLLVAEKLELM